MKLFKRWRNHGLPDALELSRRIEQWKQTPDHGDECLAAWMQTPAPESCLDELAYCEHGVWVRPDLSPDAKEAPDH